MLMAVNRIQDRSMHVDRCLDNWARWMRKREAPDGLPDHGSGGAQNYSTYDADNQRAYENLDAWLAEVTNAVIEDLEVSERCAIYSHYLQSVFRWRRATDVLDRAKEHIGEALSRRGVWLGE